MNDKLHERLPCYTSGNKTTEAMMVHASTIRGLAH